MEEIERKKQIIELCLENGKNFGSETEELVYLECSYGRCVFLEYPEPYLLMLGCFRMG